MPASRPEFASPASDLKDYVTNRLQNARAVLPILAGLPAEAKNAALQQIARTLWEARRDVLAANAVDLAAARRDGMDATRLDRLLLDEERIRQMQEGLETVASLPDPVGNCLETTIRQDGLRIDKVRVPIGVVSIVYESRPNVTVDAAAIAFKTGNAAVLRGGREALRSNQALVEAIHQGLAAAGMPTKAVQFIDRVEHETVDLMIRARGLVDLAIPRGGAGLISYVAERALVPVIETGVGNCHVFVDRTADLAMADAIVINAKTQRPSVCNAMETLLVHEAVAQAWLPQIAAELIGRGVELRVCARGKEILALSGLSPVLEATEEDWATEFLRPVLAIRVVRDLASAMDHIAQYGTRHSEAIVTEDPKAADTFLTQVDAAAVYHNASTRFTDGYEFGFGVEIGISTQKLHARGPMGLKELTSYKYIVRGQGHVRGNSPATPQVR
ncbi:MAG: glutamate-5-semialdehyde dehydrogenase [Thermaerobacter sp.]|nr:glutamate-5-semialdehyde dehydrogenase [Thermaerobacter sp.]